MTLAAEVTAWDARAARRAFGAALVALVLAWLVTAATDEGNVAWAERAGRALPVAPVCAAIGAWVALAPGRTRGELRALAALGRSAWQNARAAALGGALVAAAAGAAVAWAPRVDVGGFFPEVARGADVRVEDGAFVDAASGWRIARDGELTRAGAAARASHVPPGGRGAAGLATAAAGLALALLVAREGRRAAWLAAGAFAGALTVLLFQLAAARALAAPWATLPPLALLAAAAARYRGA